MSGAPRRSGCRFPDELFEDGHMLISHRPVGDDGTAILGYLYVESRRHAPYLADLTGTAAETIGRAVRRVALGLRTELNADFVFSAIVGMHVPHFHQHLFVRHAGTPAEHGWMTGDQWPDAPRGTTSDLVELCSRLRHCLDHSTRLGPTS
jgi:diadenosine tetraphosphate (Ap4A) HIT family hydrolase